MSKNNSVSGGKDESDEIVTKYNSKVVKNSNSNFLPFHIYTMATEKIVTSPSSPSTTNHKVDGCTDPNQGYNPLVNDEIFGQSKQPNQSMPLSTKRAVSTIPKGDFNPHHQISNVDKWVYPSEQQYYNAMRRKGYQPAEKDIPVALYVHNLVNEEGWRRIKEWEGLRANSSPVLKRFVGRPKDLSPKARLLGWLGYELPFDRHDWFIERDGKEVRYVIDFYRGKSTVQSPISMYLDVRPALDSFPAFIDTISYHLRNIFSPWSLPQSTPKNTLKSTSKTGVERKA